VPHLDRPGARLFYEDIGAGPPIVTTHGLIESAAYWGLGGVAARLSLTHRVVSLDMRGHGRTAPADGPAGLDRATVVADVLALADHLGFERFHLLGHATGGMANARLAMEHDDRLLSLILTDTSSQTVFGDPAGYDVLADAFAGGAWPALHDDLAEPLGVFLFRIDAHPEAARIRAQVRSMFEQHDPATIARFVRGFYTDPDPHVDLLRGIRCPTLVLVGEYDKALLRPSRLMADEIPDAELVVLPGVGHMTALEAPEATGDALLAFLARVEAG
jgi:pimeloyl-ACP methyl ester carboxylesterase